MQYRLFVDGACRDVASFGFVLYENKKQIDFGYGIIGSGAKVNSVMAEYFAISQGISSFTRHWNKNCTLLVFSDSKFVVSQLRKNKPDISEYYFKLVHSQIQQLRRSVSVFIKWIPRRNNIRADLLSKRLRNDLNCNSILK